VSAAVSKPGKHGSLYLYAITYVNAFDDPSCLPMTWRTWAYSAEHAEERFYDSDDDGWKILSTKRSRVP
jgi:hypothetical protein